MFLFSGGETLIPVGDAMTLVYKVDRNVDNNFVLDFGVTLCLPEEENCIMPTVYLLQNTVVPNLRCNPDQVIEIPGMDG